MILLFQFFCVWMTMWGSDATLLDVITATPVMTDTNIQANPERLFRYYTQSGNSKEPLPIYIDTASDGSSKVAWCDGTNVHVTSLSNTDGKQKVHTVSGNSVRGLVAHDDGTSAVLIKQGTVDCFLVKLGTTGNEIFKTSVDGRCVDFSLGGGRLQYDGTQYAAYYKVHEDGHEGDAYKWISADGATVTSKWDWGCSHSMEERLTYNPTIDKFGAFCLSDAYPGHGFHYNHRTKAIFDATANEGGYVAGGFGGVVATSTGWLFTVTVPQNSGAMSSNTDVALFHLAHTGGVTLTGPTWLTNTATKWEMGSHLAKLGVQPDHYLVGWIERGSDAYFTRTQDKFFLAEIDSSGNILDGPTDISSKAMFHERADFVTFPNGDVAWVASWNGGTTPDPSYTEESKFYVVRVKQSCSPNPCNNPPECYSSPGVCTQDSINGVSCAYPTMSSKGTACSGSGGECDGSGACDVCLSNSLVCPASNAPSCRQGAGACNSAGCDYSNLAATATPCPDGACNSAGNCVGDCNDPSCSQCSSTSAATCTQCLGNKILDNGCCVDSICLNVDGIGSASGSFLKTGETGGKPYYYNAAAERYLTFYCCGWGWAITNQAGGGSAYKRSMNPDAATAIESTGDWNGDTVTITSCDLCATKDCTNPPACYKLPGTCNVCGVCDYALENSGTPCNDGNGVGSCNKVGQCISGVITTSSPTRSSVPPTTLSPTAQPQCPAQDIWPATNIGITQQIVCPPGSSGTHTRICNGGAVWGSAVNLCVVSPTCNDMKQNADEEGIDCGGSCPSSCSFCQGVICTPHGTCNENTKSCDCTGGYTGDRCDKVPVDLCTGISCGAHGSCDLMVGPPCICTEGWEGDYCTLQPYGNCSNGIQDGDETGVDCGGSRCDSTPICTSPFFEATDFSPCSVTCGRGIQQVTVVCKDADGIVQLNHDLCVSGNAHPISATRECVNGVDCAVYTWITESYGGCTQTCGGGLQSRPIMCMSSSGNVVVESSKCSLNDKPVETQSCNSQACTGFHWAVPLWGECSRTCGGGKQNRSVICLNKNEREVDSKKCVTDIHNYTTTKACNIHQCDIYSWNACPMWEPCTASCGGGYGMLGVQRRDAFCKNSMGVIIDSSLCGDTYNKPTMEINGCNSQPCTDYNWMADSTWGLCVNGVKIRSFHCHGPDGSNENDDVCTNAGIPLPPSQMDCQADTCSTYEIIPNLPSSATMTVTTFSQSFFTANVLIFLGGYFGNI